VSTRKKQSWESEKTKVAEPPARDTFLGIKTTQENVSDKPRSAISGGARKGTFRVSVKGKFFAADNALARLLGATDGEALRDGAVAQIFSVPEELGRLVVLAEASDTPVGIETVLSRVDRSTFAGWISLRAVRDASGTTMSYAGTVIEILDDQAAPPETSTTPTEVDDGGEPATVAADADQPGEVSQAEPITPTDQADAVAAEDVPMVPPIEDAPIDSESTQQQPKPDLRRESRATSETAAAASTEEAGEDVAAGQPPSDVAEDAVQSGGVSFAAVFEHAPVAISVEDYSEVKHALDELRAAGITEFPTYFAEHPEFVERAVMLVKTVEINPTALALYGAASKEELLASLDKLFTPEAYDAFIERLVAIAEGRPRFETSLHSVALDGRQLDLRQSVRIPTERTDFRHLVVCTTDLTGSANRLADLETSRASLEALLERTTSGMLVVDHNSIVRFANPAAGILLGRSAPSLLGSPVDFALADGTLTEHVVDGAGSSDRVVEVHVTPTEWHGDDAHLVVVRDMSDQRHTEKALDRQSAYLEHLFESAQEAIVIGDSDGRVLRVNNEFKRMFGYSKNEAVDRQIDELLTPAELMEEAAAATRATASGQRVSLETLRRRKDGKLIHVQLIGSPIKLGEEQVGVYGIYRDITEQKQAEHALVREKSYLDQLIESAPEGIVITDNEGRIVRVNSEFKRMFGYSKRDAQGRSIDDLVAPPGMHKEATGLTKQVSRGQKISQETLRRRKDGSLIHVSVIASPIVIDSVQVGIYGIYRDITDRKLAEEGQRKQKAYLEQLFESAQEGIVLCDFEGRVLRANDEFERIFGYSRTETVGCRLDDLVAPADQHAAANEFSRRVAAGERISFHAVRQLKDGSLINVSVIGAPIVVDGEQLASYAIYRDITEREHAEQALRVSERRYRQLFEAAGDAIIVFDPKDEILLDINPAACALYGLPREQLLGRSLRDFTKDAGHGTTLGAELLERRETLSFETTHLRADGTPIDLLVDAVLIDFDGRPAVLSINRDITQRKRIETQLVQSQRLEAVGRLAGGVAHDFNNVLQAMLGLTEILRSHVGDPEWVDAMVAELEQHLKRAAGLTRQLLLFSRRETAKLEPIDLNELVRSTSGFLRRLIRENIALSMELNSEQLVILADRGQLEQVLMNLTVNAVDAMPDGGEIRIATFRADAAHVALAVVDHGHGIDDDIMPHIFEPFFTTKPAGAGSGLGLSVVQGIVLRHGGVVEVDSMVGRGTTVTARLPMAPADTPAPVREDVPSDEDLPRGAGQRVLIVEDEEGARLALADIVRMLGYSVTAVGTGSEAGLLPTEPPFDVLLSDLMLPDVFGGNLANGLQDRWPSLRIVLMSGYSEDESIRERVKAGHLRFLQKPFSMATLARELRATLNDR
jgi:two-component system cell cycle sensor histidine kinase/response regulator CckA